MSLAPTVTPGKVTIYLCGATVQGSPHIGHMRSAIAFDVLTRWLEYCGQEVVLVRNVTDIDDKILAKSAQAGAPWWAWAYRYEREFSAAYQALGVKDPTYEPHATGHIIEQIQLVQQILDAGYAYVSNGSVYFDVVKYDQDFHYGVLSGRNLEEVRDASRELDGVGEKRHQVDFALWKKHNPNTSCAGLHPGARDSPAGTASARPWDANISAKNSTFTAAAWI